MFSLAGALWPPMAYGPMHRQSLNVAHSVAGSPLLGFDARLLDHALKERVLGVHDRPELGGGVADADHAAVLQLRFNIGSFQKRLDLRGGSVQVDSFPGF